MPGSLRSRRRVRIGAAVVVLAAVLAALPLAAPASQPAPTGARRATIHRTSYGIPHIVADDFESLGFGHGYATAEDSACVLADTLVTVRGERSRWFGPEGKYTDQVTLAATNLQADVVFTDIRNRGVVQQLLDDPTRGPSADTRALVRGYIAGVNHYLATVGGAAGITDPACKGAPWVQPGTEMDLWHGIYAANLLASAGVFVPQIADAAPPTPDDLGLPVSATASGFAAPPLRLPAAAALQERLGRGGSPFGSNGTALGGDATVTGKGMVLGNPHFPWRGRYRFTQAHLTIPGQYNVAGGMLLGAPVVNIGWNDDVAWTHTVSTAYRFTPYEYRLVPGAPTTYLTTEGPRELERREVKVTARRADGTLHEIVEDVYRTDEGYVLDAPDVLMGWTPVSVFAIREANAEHLRTIDVFHEMAKATSVEELLAAHDRTGGMPWVNTMAADRHGNALYADHSVVPNVPDDLVNQCVTPIGLALFQLAGLPGLDGTRAKGDCAWRDDPDASRPGIFGSEHLPDTIRRDWVVNANDSYWLPNPAQPLEGYARIIGCEQCERSLRTRMVYRYVMDRLAGTDGLGGTPKFTHAQLQAIEHENRVFAAELAREDDDLADVCAAAGGGEACDVLAGWDGRSNIDSVGAHVFREFFTRTPAERWEEAFDAARPVETPRNLDEGNADVVAAMEEALAWLQDEGIAFDAPLGQLQLAGDDGAPPIPIGGGDAESGNANVVMTTDPGANEDAPYPITYGSSHIQAVAFTDDGPQAATILTYGLATDPTRPYAADQTQLFSQEKWVDFPWTMAEINADPAHRSYTVVQGVVVERSDGAPAGPQTLPATGSSGGPLGAAFLAIAAGVGMARIRRRAGHAHSRA
jgi:acyl-homoserine-lactone acylase